MVLLGGCAVQPPSSYTPPAEPLAVDGVPFHAQTDQQCGPAALAMVLGWAGTDTTPAALADEVMSPARDGSLQPSLIAAARRHGMLAYEIQGEAALDAELAAEHPVIVLQNLGLSWLPAWHYAVVIGRDREAVTLHSGTRESTTTGLRPFRNTWARGEHWGLVVLPPGQVPASATPIAYAAAVVGLERALEGEPVVRAWAAGTERWPHTDVLWIGLANARHAQGDGPGAIAALESAAGQLPDSAVVWNNLAHLRLEAGDAAGATDAAQRAVALGGPHLDTARATLAAAQDAAAAQAYACPCEGEP